jgi:hypothetical protein
MSHTMRSVGWIFNLKLANLILTDSMSSIRAIESRKISLHTHSFVYECKQKCWQLTPSGREVSFIWVPAHVGIAGNERADFEVRQATLSRWGPNTASIGHDLRNLYFFDRLDVAFVCTGFKGPPQGSILSPFMYNFYTRLVAICG